MPKEKVEEKKKRKGCLGCSFPVTIGFVVLFLILGIISLLGGALGVEMIGGGEKILPSIFSVGQPHPQLPAEGLFHIFGFQVTNTMLASWISIIVLVALFYFATQRMKLIPNRLQIMAESIITYLHDFCTDIAGDKYGRKFFPLIATIFLFVIANAWMNLIPGYGTITYTGHEGEIMHLLRGANTDINFPIVLALISFVFVEFWGIKTLGIKAYTGKFLNGRRFIAAHKKIFTGKLKEGFGGLFYGLIDLFIGFLEFISEIMRIVSFTFRLFGNMTGGEILLLMIVFLVPYLIAIPFYGLEILVGFIQALIFAGLTLVFASIAMAPAHNEE